MLTIYTSENLNPAVLELDLRIVITTNGTYPLSFVRQICEMLCVRGVEVDRESRGKLFEGT
jgi:hypothetical protein